jgi:DNA repair protein RecO (recombination protein O)
LPLPRVYETEAIVIRKMNLGEADRLLTLYTPGLGKVKAVAKGVRRPKSKLGGNVELLTYSRLLLARGRTLDIITQSQTIDSFMPLKADLQRASWALYAAELVDRFTPERMASPALFELLLETLNRLVSEDGGELTMRYFELHLLESAGYRPQLSHCPACNMVLSSAPRLAFSPVAGGLLCLKCRASEPEAYSLSATAIRMLCYLQDSNFEALLKEELSPGLSVEIGRVLQEYISYILEGRVKSAAWLSHLRGMKRPYP